ncbi:MAG: thioredoxin-dependent thiol peroxidase [Phycisphaerales bacterium]
MIEVGKKAPAFSLKDQAGTTHALKDYLGAPLVIYFYPKDQTSGCTKQACQFRDALPAFEDLGCAVLGVSPQDVDSKKKFADKESLNFPILADPNAKVCDKYGVWQEKSMYGNTYMGVVRTTYLIGPDGKVAHRWDKVRVPDHAKKVLKEIEALACGADGA